MIDQIVLLADETAHYRIGGLTQIDRLLLAIQESSSNGHGSAARPEVAILWRTEALARQWEGARPPISVPVVEINGQSPSGKRNALIRTNLVVGRGVMSGLLERAEHNGDSQRLPIAVREEGMDFGGAGSERWERVTALLPPPAQPARGHTHRSRGFVDVVSDPGEVSEVEKRFFRSLGKTSDGYTAKHLNRPLSNRISRFLSRSQVTPNQLSFFLLLLMFVGAGTLMVGSPAGFVAGMFIFHLVSIFDGCDGEIARGKYLDSRSGAWVDTIIDLFGLHLLVISLGIGLSRQPGLEVAWRSLYLWEGILTAAVMLVTIWGIAYIRHKQGGEGHFGEFGKSIIDTSPLQGRAEKIFQVLFKLFRRDSYVLIFVFVTLAGRPEWVLHLLAIGVVGHLAGLLYTLRTTPPASGTCVTSLRPSSRAD